jgi:hypothetical protein
MLQKWCQAIVPGALLLAAMSLPAAACSGLKGVGVSATGSFHPNRLAVAMEVKNTGKDACRVFAFKRVTAVDNAGHNWDEAPYPRYISGVYVCENDPECLGSHKDETETNATVIEPGQSVALTLSFSRGDLEEPFGSQASIGLVLMAQALKGEQPAGKWHSVSVGVTGIPLKSK